MQNGVSVSFLLHIILSKIRSANSCDVGNCNEAVELATNIVISTQVTYTTLFTFEVLLNRYWKLHLIIGSFVVDVYIHTEINILKTD